MQAMKSLEDCIADISEWIGCNSLKINEDKTEFVIFSRNPDKYRDITLQIIAQTTLSQVTMSKFWASH